jgi:hypothetical protein
MATNAKRWMVVLATAASAAQAPAQDMNLEALERAFWRCDHAATTGVLHSGEAMACSVASEAFKARRFGGDFAALLVWWRANKDAQHLALSNELVRPVSRVAPRP